jgi:hypothetical protein
MYFRSLMAAVARANLCPLAILVDSGTRRRWETPFSRLIFARQRGPMPGGKRPPKKCPAATEGAHS